MELSPAATFVEVERDVLTDIYAIAHSPLVSGAALDAMLVFFATLVQADGQIATHVVPNLVLSAEKAPKTESSPGNVAKCVAQVVKNQQSIAAGTIAEFSKHIKVLSLVPFVSSRRLINFFFTQKTSKSKPSQVVLSLMILGELGRFMYMISCFFVPSACC